MQFSAGYEAYHAVLSDTNVNTAAVAAVTVQLSCNAGDLQVYLLRHTFRSTHGCYLRSTLRSYARL